MFDEGFLDPLHCPDEVGVVFEASFVDSSEGTSASDLDDERPTSRI